jgi:acyl-CoA oxidase
LEKIYNIYAFWCLDKHLATFYQGTYASGPKFSDYIRTELLRNCAELKDAAVSIADALAPPDWVLNSVLGRSDGKVSEAFFALSKEKL